MVRKINRSDAFVWGGGSFKRQLPYIFVTPVFFLVFSLLYNPFGIQESYSGTGFSDSFNLVMLSCIILGVMSITRLMLHLVLKSQDLQWSVNIAWCLMEVTAMSMFMALYTYLMCKPTDGYFKTVAACFKFSSASLIYPYLVMTLTRIIFNKNDELENRKQQESNSLMHFFDEHHRLKLTITPSSVLYVKAESNYVSIKYIDSGRVRDFMLRASMKSIDKPSFSHCLVRCQRSYFVNPEHVSVLRKDRDGFIFAEMNIEGVPPVPVSKQYYENLSQLL